MKKILFLCGFLTLGFNSFGQNYFEIKTIGDKYSEELIQSAFENANLCGYYYSEERRIIVLDDNSKIVLYAGNESENISDECIVSAKEDTAVYRISENGIIIRTLPVQEFKQEK